VVVLSERMAKIYIDYELTRAAVARCLTFATSLLFTYNYNCMLLTALSPIDAGGAAGGPLSIRCHQSRSPNLRPQWRTAVPDYVQFRW
jgi:hypothetical protein